MDHIGQWLQERAAAEARGEVQPYDAKKIEEEMIDGATSWVKDQFSTKEEKEAKAKKKREEIEERERKEREAAGPSLADLFSGFKFGSGRSPFYHLQGGMEDPREPFWRAHPDMRKVDEELDAKIRQMQERDAEMRERERQRQAAIAAAEAARLAAIREAENRPTEKGERQWGGMINPFDKDGNIIDHPLNPFDKDGKRKPRQPMEDDSMFQTPFVPEFDWIENERRTTNPFYHLQGAGQIEDFIGAMDNPYTKDKLTQGAISSVSYLGSKLLDHLLKGGEMPTQLVGSGLDDFMNDLMLDIAKDGIKKGMDIFNKLKGSGWEDDLNAFVGDQLGKLIFGGIAHNPKGHTTRNNNLTKQKPQKKKFCGFKSKVFEHKPYDPASMHKFRAATCGGPLSHGGRPTGAQNKQGYTKSGEFTERRKQYGESREFRKRIMGEGKQMQIMPDEDDLVSKKENPVVDQIIHEPMDDGDIRTYFPKARVLRYAELADYDDIEELLPKDKSYVFLLYQHRPNDGHFVCLMRYGTTIEFFCSYGSKIDGPLYWTPLRARQALGEGKPYLSLLLRKAGKRFKAVHNPVAFQSKKGGVATCGAYCVMRVNQLVNHNQDLHEFIDYMEELKKETGLSYDEIAANYVNKR
jgi:hypothetical protein